MRTITIKKTLYTFSELSEEAKNQAVSERRQEIEKDYYIYEDYFKDTVATVLETWNDTGIEVDVNDVSYSISYSQGDGVSFVSQGIDIEQALKFYSKQGDKQEKVVEKIRKDKNYKYVKENFEFTIRRIDTMYTHEYTVDCYFTDTTYEYTDGQWELAERISKIINQIKNDICEHIYHELLETDLYINSDEFITELLESEDNEYTSDGIEYYN